MTMPDERLRAVNAAREFMYALIDPKATPRVPRDVRRRALRVLRHYPMPFEMEYAAKKAPQVFASRREP